MRFPSRALAGAAVLLACSICARADSLFPAGATPANAADPDSKAVELGVRFQSSVPGQVTGVRFYKGAGNTGAHVANLWDASGKKLASATFSGETASGWQQVNFATPVAILANAQYTASYFAPAGRYAWNNPYFASANTVGVLTTPLNAGRFKYSTSSAYPTEVWGSTNYWVDVVFAPSASPPQPPSEPVVTGTGFAKWQAPTAKEDGTALTDLAGYRLRYGTSATDLDRTLTIADPAATSVQIPGLTPGTWYFAVLAYTKAGTESALSRIGVEDVTADASPPPTCGPKPADETRMQACAAGTTGSWSQARTYASAAYPTCWTPGAWSPSTAPAGACVPPPSWVVRSASSGSRPAYELVRDAADTKWVQGYKLGDLPTGKPCDPVKQLGSSTTEYHKVSEADVVLLSPTYRGRTLVAVCAKP